MLNLVFVSLIFTEIIAVCFAVFKLITLEKRVLEINSRVVEYIPIVESMHFKIQKGIKALNFVVSIFTNKKIIQIRKTISSIISIIEVILVLQSIDVKRGFRFNFKNYKKLLFAGATRQLIRKIIDYFVVFCR